MSSVKISFLQIILGLIVLTTGLKLFWFFVGVMFFVFGMYVLMDLFHMKSRWGIQLIGIAVGVIGILLGIYLKSIALVMVSFISGGYGSYYLAQLLGIKSGTLRWIFFLVGGILAIILLAANYEWALILLSSWSGATLVGKHLTIRRGTDFVLFLSLTLIGVLIQAVILLG